MKKFLITLPIFLAFQIAICQNTSYILNNQYLFGNQPFALPIPTTDPNTGFPNQPNNGQDLMYDGHSASYAQNIQVNSNGELEFFIIDEIIYDKDGYGIDFLFGTTSLGTVDLARGSSEIMVVPFPGNCRKYYIFTVVSEQFAFQKNPMMYILDMNQTNAYFSAANNPCSFYGALVDLNGNLVTGQSPNGIDLVSLHGENLGGTKPWPEFYPEDPSPGKTSGTYFAGSKPQVDGSRRIFITNGYGVMIYSLDATGLEYLNFIPFVNAAFNQFSTRSELEIHQLPNGNFRLATAYRIDIPMNPYGHEDAVFVAEVTSLGNLVPGTVKTFPITELSNDGTDGHVRGLEFSLAGTKAAGDILYVTHETNTVQPNSLEYYDFTVGGTTLTPISSNALFKHSMIERTLDGKIIVATSNGIYQIQNTSVSASPIINTPIPLSLEFGARPFFLLQDHLDDTDYSSNFSQNVECCIFASVFQVGNYSASTSTWSPSGNNPFGVNNEIFIESELRIPANQVVTINNLTLRFAPGARLVVENGTGGQQGGRLILNNSTLTADNRCDNSAMWLGVEVWGNQNQAQGSLTNSTQGRLIMSNSKIEHAEIGVLVSKRNSFVDPNFPCNDPSITGQFLDAFNGGIVRATNSDFENNRRGVYFRKYLSPITLANNLSSFTTSDFEWNSSYRGGTSGLLEQARLETVKGINFRGCEFLLDNPQDYTVNGTGTGIRALESQFYVNEFCPVLLPFGSPCPSAIASRFGNLYAGIYASNSNQLSFVVDKAVFTDNRYGTVAIGTDKERVTRNTFEVREMPTGLQSAGLIMAFSTGYQVEDNTFYEYDNTSVAHGDGNSYGILVHQSGTDNNQIYRNNFRDLRIGIQAERINGLNVYNGNSLASSQGLELQCNVFKTDIYLTDIGVNGDIDYQQGYETNMGTIEDVAKSAARNQFSLFGENPLTWPTHDITVTQNSDEFEYVHLAINTHTPDNFTVNKVFPNVQTYFGNPINQEYNSCPSKFSKKISLLKSEETNHLVVIDSERAKVDNNNTQSLLSLVQSNTSSGNKKNALMAVSPYLSDAVLLAYIASNPPAGHLKQVILANSPVSATVLAALQNANIPNGTMNQINNAQTGVSAMYYLSQNIRYNENELVDVRNNIKSQLLLDSTELANVDGYVAYLKEIGDRKSIEELLSIYIDRGNVGTGLDTLRNALTVQNMCSEKLELTRVNEDLRNLESNCIALTNDPSLSTRLNSVIQNTSDECTAARAKCLLSFINGDDPVFDFLPLIGYSPMSMYYGTSNSDNQSLKVSKVYPNPASNLVYFDLSELPEGTFSVTLYDLAGKQVKSASFTETNAEAINISELDNGFFIAVIQLDDYQETVRIQKM